jgi:hypothetical protein
MKLYRIDDIDAQRAARTPTSGIERSHRRSRAAWGGIRLFIAVLASPADSIMSFLSLGEWPSQEYREYRTTGVRLLKRRSHRYRVGEALSLGTQIRGLNMTLPTGIALSANARRPPFDNVTIFFHWVTVLIVLPMFTSAWLSSQSQDVAFTSVLLQIHKSLGAVPGTAIRAAASSSRVLPQMSIQ